jgi:DNA-directed RNA polymerase specialized sigma24 family protein|tara:strand:- start:1792 stop:2286 length:495 start_codon:yes stop_codon:yes gene_type:complete
MKINLNDIFQKHKIWIDIVCSFGCNPDIAEDIVQEMYIKIHKKISNGLNINYGDNDYNYYYIFKTLKTLFLDLKRKQSKVSVISINEIKHILPSDYDNMVNFDYTYNEIKKELKKMYWYDRKVFEIIEGGESIAEFSRKSGIPYYSLYNTYKKVKNKLKKLLWD